MEKEQFCNRSVYSDSEAGTTHLKFLSQVARLLMHKDVTEGLKQAQSAEEIAELLNQKLEEN